MGANRRELLVQAATRFAHEIADILDLAPATLSEKAGAR